MAIRISTAIIAACLITGLGASAAFAAPLSARGLEQVQYDRYPNQAQAPYGYGAQNPPPYGYDNRDRGQYGGYDDRDYRGGRKWRPGEVLPQQFLGRMVFDWEERGLSRPPGGHEWVRVGFQFILVRDRDRMIARILNFD